MLVYKAYGELLEKYEVKSEGLKRLRSACNEMYENPDFKKLITFCSKYENFSAGGYWDFKFALNDEGHIEAYELIDHRYIHVTDPELKKKGFSLFKKAEETVYSCQRLTPAKDGLYERLAISALSDLSGVFAKISEQIFEKYGSIGRELDLLRCCAQVYSSFVGEKSACSLSHIHGRSKYLHQKSIRPLSVDVEVQLVQCHPQRFYAW